MITGSLSLVGCEPAEEKAIITTKDVQDIIIPTEQAQELYNTYTKRRVGIIRNYENEIDSVGQEVGSQDNDPKGQYRKEQIRKAEAQKKMEQADDAGFKPTRYAFYDYKSLKKYMAFIEQEADKANVDISTLRFYFANYPNKDSFDNNSPITERRRNTLVFIPTVNTGSQEFAFYTADDSDDGERKAFLLNEELIENKQTFGGKGTSEASFTFTPSLNSLSAPLAPQNAQSLAGNEFGLRPPK